MKRETKRNSMKTIYPNPIPAKYRYLTPDFRGSYRVWFAAVEVLGETEKRYWIKLKQGTHNRLAGERMWVDKKNVKIDKPKTIIETENYWYNKEK